MIYLDARKLIMNLLGYKQSLVHANVPRKEI